MSREAFKAWVEANPDASDAELIAKRDEFKRASGVGTRNKVLGLIESAAQGPSFGWSDEISAGLGALPALIPGGQSFPEAYRTNVDAIRSNLERTRAENPVLSPTLEIGAGMATGGVGAGKLVASQLMQRLPPAVRALGSAGGAAGAGAVAGAGTANTMEEVPGHAATGAAVGAVMSPAIALGGRGLTWAGRNLKQLYEGLGRSPGSDARRQALNTLEAIGMDEAAFRQRMDELGPDAVMADLGEVQQRTLQDLTVSDMGIGHRVERQLSDRARGGRQRLLDDASATMGVPQQSFHYGLKAIRAARKEAAQQQYGPIYDEIIPPTDELEAILNRPSAKKGLTTAMRLSADAGEELPMFLDPDGKIVAAPTLKTLDQLKQGIDAVIEREKGDFGAHTAESRAATIAKKALLSYIEDNHPRLAAQYGQARSTYAGYSALQDAMKTGNNIFKVEADELEDVVSEMGASEREAFRVGALNAVRDEIESVRDTGTAANRAKFATEKYRRRLRNAFDSEDDFDAFMQAIDREQTFQGTRNAVEGNSATAQRLADIQKRAERTGLGPIEDVQNGATAAAMAAAKRAWEKGAPQATYPQLVNERLGEMLSTSPVAPIIDDVYRQTMARRFPTPNIPFSAFGAVAGGALPQMDVPYIQGMVSGQ
jgi:hypothetical protein